MNIVIPSRAIHSKEHSLVKDNAITRIEVSVARASKPIENGSVYDEQLSISGRQEVYLKSNSESNRMEISYKQDGLFGGYYRAGVYLKHTVHFCKVTIEVPFKSKNKKVLSTNNIASEDFLIPVDFSVSSAKKTTQQISGHITRYYENPEDITDVGNEGEISEEYVSSIPSLTNVSVQKENADNNEVFAEIKSDAFVNERASEYYSISTSSTRVKYEFRFPYKTVVEEASGTDKTESFGGSMVVSGERNTYLVEKASFSVQGKQILLQIESEPKTIGTGDKPFKIEGNEFVQDENVYQTTLEQYEDGKETVKLRCALIDYFDESGAKVISSRGSDSLPMTLKVGDKIIPYVITAEGDDEPLSTYADGLRKVYSVTSVRYLYDGASWQEISAQEELQRDTYYTITLGGVTTYVVQGSNNTQIEKTVYITATTE